jgi:hypothetical protein
MRPPRSRFVILTCLPDSVHGHVSQGIPRPSINKILAQSTILNFNYKETFFQRVSFEFLFSITK